MRATGLGALVLTEGALVEGAGRVSVWRGEAWFESWDVATRLGDESSQRDMPAVPRLGPHAVPLDGVRVDRLHDRRVADDVVDGLAVLTGEWLTRGVRAGVPRLRVVSQDDRLEALSERWGCTLGEGPDDVPCPEPDGGWPGLRPDEDLDVPDGLHTAPGVTRLRLARPAPGLGVLVVESYDPAATRAHLDRLVATGALAAGAFCVRPVRRSGTGADRAFEELRPRMDALQVTLLGGGVDADGTPVLHAHVARVLPELADWADRLPADLLHVEPWLRPVGS